jgi:Tol biopolymer transport system component
MSRDGSGARAVRPHRASGDFVESLVWLSSKELAYAIFTPKADGTTDRRVEALDLTSGVIRRLVDNADQPSLLADGRRLIVRLADDRPGRSGETPVAVDIVSGRIDDLPGYEKFQLLFIGSFARSPDGKQIAFGAADPSVRAPLPMPQRGTSAPVAALHPILQDVWLMDPDGNNLRRIADLAVASPSLAWSEDGFFIYAMSSTGFWRIEAKTGAYQTIGPGLQNGRIRLMPSR